MTLQKTLFGLGLATLLLAAFALRVWDINHLPSGLWIDEAVNAADAHTALETGRFKIFYPNNYGREGLFINLQAFSLWLFGDSVFALKLWSAIFGTLAVLGTYLLGKELFGRRAPAFFAAASLAFSYWAINFSRIGFRAIMTSAYLAFAFFFFFKGLRTQKLLPFLFSGLFVGLGLHGYIASRLVPGIFILLLPFLLLSYPHFIKRFWKHALVFALGAIITAGPMLYHFFISNPEHFASRSAAVSVLAPEVNQGDLVGTLLTSLTLSLQKYNLVGDANWRHNLPPYPLLDPITGVFFLSGFLFLTFQLGTLLWQRIRGGTPDARLTRNAFLLTSFFVMLAPEFLTKEGVPHALRAIGTQVPVFLMAGFSMYWLYRYGERALPFSKKLFHTLLIVVVVGAASINIIKYFGVFRDAPEQKASFTYAQVHMASFLKTLPPEQTKYLVTSDRSQIEGNAWPIDLQPLAFYTYRQVSNMVVLQPGTDQELVPGSVLVMTHNDKALVQKILSLYPASTTKTIDYEPGSRSDFVVIFLK
jgi:4-amino-4-deoxy-L-arabinose transferase-like glycosyltransferase